MFQAISQKIDFSGQICENFRFSQVILYKISIFHGKFKKNIDFKIKIGYLQPFLGKLFHFSLKVTTFEHISCTL